MPDFNLDTIEGVIAAFTNKAGELPGGCSFVWETLTGS